MQISVVLPIYNSAATLKLLVGNIDRTLAGIADDYEIILINDGSRDQSWQVILELASSSPKIKPINLSKNYGEHSATLCGIRAANFSTTVTLDDDLQYPAEEIALLVEKLEEGFDVVYGSPIKEQQPLVRKLASKLTKLLMQKMIGIQEARSISSFRAFRTRLREAFQNVGGDFINIDVLLSWGAGAYGTVKVQHHPRAQGASTYTVAKLITHSLNMITGFTTAPLQLLTWSGFLCVVLTVPLLGCAFAIPWDGSPLGPAILVATVLLPCLGAQLLALGLIGEYLRRNYFAMTTKPAYLIDKTGLDRSAHRITGDRQVALSER